MATPGVRVLIRESPRSIALASSSHALVLKNSGGSPPHNGGFSSGNTSAGDLGSAPLATSPRCIAEFGPAEDFDLDYWRQLGFKQVYGTLGLVTINNEVFLCVVDSAVRAAEVRPGETVQKINSVEFHCLTSAKYDHLLNDTVNPWPTDDVDEAGYDIAHPRSETEPEHPCLALKKLLSSGTFFYSADFDLTRRLQKRVTDDEPSIAIDSLDAGFLWNSYMIQPLVDFRARLSRHEKDALDGSRILTSAIRGFCTTMTVPWSSSPFQTGRSGMPSALTIISRLSCRRAGTRFNARGIDDDGNVANFVESETVFWSASGLCFSYAQIRGSVPIFWEQATGLLPGQQKITISRSPQATQPAFDKHFEQLERSYGAVHVVNLLSAEKSSEIQISNLYRQHIENSPLNTVSKGDQYDHKLLRETEYDFHAETRGPSGYEAASGIQQYIQQSADGFVFFLSDEKEAVDNAGHITWKSTPILQQDGIFRTNCLDCLDRTNLIQTILSQMALKSFFVQRRETGTADFWSRHRTIWADNGDTLSRIYAGTGALKSSFTRHGKMSLGGVLSDARKSATRLYINNFADKGRQNTIDLLLGRLMGQQPVHLHDPVNDWVQAELRRRASEYTSSKEIHIMVATFNLNGKNRPTKEDLSAWLCPPVDSSQRNPEIIAVGFQEIVELSPQQIMSTDPYPRQAWENAVKDTLNQNAAQFQEEEYVLLRGGQLVGASLSLFVRVSVLPYIKNVEGSIKKTGLSGMAGNKGAVAIRIDYASTSLCFVTAHLAAGFANYDERNRDYKTISQGLRFQRNRTIDDHENVIWLGDFNYRIGLPNDRVRQLINEGDLETLYANDQLNIQMTHGNVFRHYDEARIAFNPTYKFDNGTDTYDTSDKSRVPAWTDRVLRKGDNLKQINYNIAPLRFSDHRPVYATFSCTISVINESIRDTLMGDLFRRRRLSTHPTSSFAEEDLLSDITTDSAPNAKPIDSSLPPPSSNRRKWWLDNGVPARVDLKALNINPQTNSGSNPFPDESEWVKIDRDIPEPPPPRRGGQSTPSVRRKEIPPVKLPPINLPPNLPRRLSTASTSSTREKPPVRAKPKSLSSGPVSPISNSRPGSMASFTPTGTPNGPPSVPPPRRSRASVIDSMTPSPSPPVSIPAGSKPPVPQKKPSLIAARSPSYANLMEEHDGEMDGLKDWEVLRPMR
ncbi:hypothetical protein BT63DRAFT_372793 [Microthyrium microscopicum]|uniref:phosphoinositide 5-phosphatase n=1 Tax=Microthyrium microscopicum TaxID=703497 RepID=A0A6A6UDC3_9PEZI|nr:hypothetical protein BT63DRAFT_372793 [Microthyrium microscopicum]